jgi:hypothetical protein
MGREFEAGFEAGLLACIDLLRAEATVGDVAALLPVDPAVYQDWLRELRRILAPSWQSTVSGNGRFPEFSEGYIGAQKGQFNRANRGPIERIVPCRRRHWELT